MLINSETTFIDTCAIARLTKTSKSFWEKLRCRGEGPKYYKVGRIVLYRLSEIEAYLEARSVIPEGDDE